MTPRRRMVLVGMIVGLLWALAVIVIGSRVVVLPVFALLPALSFAFLGPGIVLALVIGRIAQRRFFDDRIIDGDPLPDGSPAQIDARVLANTVEQIVLALCLWPPCAYLLGEKGPGMLVTLGLAFTLARLAFWIGYHLSPPLRGFGFAASFYPTLLVVLVALGRYAGGAI